MTPRNARPITLVFGLLAAASTLALAGCEDAFGPQDWAAIAHSDSVTLYSLSRAEHATRPGGYDAISLNPLVIENAGVPAFSYDFLLAEDDAGALVFLPTGYFPDATVRPGILRVDTASFAGFRRAPREDYVEEEPVPVEVGGVYAIRTRTTARGCPLYGKLEVLAATAEGTVDFRILRNPNCGDRDLLPTLEDEEEEEEEGEG